MTIGELLKEGVRFFAKEGLEPSGLLAERLLEASLSRKRYELYLDGHEEVSQESVERYWTLLKKRLKGIPSQYLLQKADFMDFALHVDEQCFIPRPETELLVEKVLEKVKERNLSGIPLRILDVGTGSGNIAIALASYLPEARVTAVDCAEEALEVARLNARHHEVAHRIHFLKTDLFEGLPAALFDLIVSNPPYLSRAEMDSLPREVACEPRLALYGGDQGTEFIERLVDRAPAWIRGGGFLAFEFGAGQGDFVRSRLVQTFWDSVEIYKDTGGVDRVVLAEKVPGTF